MLYSVKNELNIDSETSLLPQSDLNELELENLPSIEEQTEKIEQTKKHMLKEFNTKCACLSHVI